MSRVAVLALVCVGLFASVAQAKEPSYAEKKACEHMLEYLDEADQVLAKLAPDAFTTKFGADTVEARITKSKQEMGRCPKDQPSIATAEERITKLRAAVATKVEEAKALAPGAKKVTAGVKAWVSNFEVTREREPMVFQDANHPSVVALRDELAALDKKLAAAGNPEHPDARDAAAALAAARAQLEAALAAQQQALAALGDWKAKAKVLTEPLDGRSVMQVPIDDAKVDAWIDQLPAFQANLDAATAFRDLVRANVKDVAQAPEFRAFNDAVWAEKNAFEMATTNWYSNFLNDLTLAEAQKVDFEKLNIGVGGFGNARRTIENGIWAAKHKEHFLRVFKKDEAGAAEAAAEVKTYEAKLARLEETEDKLLDAVRLPKGTNAPELQKLMKQVIASKDFAAQMKDEGNTLLRAVVVDPAINHTNTREWYKGRWYTRDFDSFSCMAALKNAHNKKVWMWRFDVRFARSELPDIKTGVWTFGSWHRFGPIREANVNK